MKICFTSTKGEDPDEMPHNVDPVAILHNAAFHLGLHCLGFSHIQKINQELCQTLITCVEKIKINEAVSFFFDKMK